MNYQELAEKAIAGPGIDQGEAEKVMRLPGPELFALLSAAEKVRRHYKGNKVKLCAIVNAKSGRCSENCSFCAQSAHYKTGVKTYPLLSEKEMLKAASAAEKKMSATCFSIVTSGRAVHSDAEITVICEALKNITRGTKLNRCVSLGTLRAEQIKRLKEAGLKRLHHNLETAESYFNKVCTTHPYQERINTLKLAKENGMEVCSGGIFGLGETMEQRIELAFTLKALDVQSVPINLLHPIPGTPAAENHPPMTPLEVLKLTAAYRFILPAKDIGVFGGREKALGTLQPLMFAAGANAMLIGNYLTTKGRPPEKDLRMIRELGLEIDTACPELVHGI